MALICDTGPILAALDQADPDHQRCAELLVQTDEDLVVPTLVLAEVDYWCHERLTAEAWLRFFDDVLAGVYRHEPPTDRDFTRCKEIQEQYYDLQIGVVDASVIALAERLDEPKVASLDQRHFTAVRPRHVAYLHLVPN
jgi:predicted nucleic acid-binding protein